MRRLLARGLGLPLPSLSAGSPTGSGTNSPISTPRTCFLSASRASMAASSAGTCQPQISWWPNLLARMACLEQFRYVSFVRHHPFSILHTLDRSKSRSPLDLYKQVLNVKFMNATITLKENEQYQASMIKTGTYIHEQLRRAQQAFFHLYSNATVLTFLFPVL